MTTTATPKRKLSATKEKRSLLLRYVRAQAKRDATQALRLLREEIERYHSLNPASEDALWIAHRYWDGLAIYDREALYSVSTEEGRCDLVLNFDCESASDYDLEELSPAFAEVGYERVLVHVRGLAEEMHQLFIEMQRVAVAYERWQIEDATEDEDDWPETLA